MELPCCDALAAGVAALYLCQSAGGSTPLRQVYAQGRPAQHSPAQGSLPPLPNSSGSAIG
jgi:hypothetical protein